MKKLFLFIFIIGFNHASRSQGPDSLTHLLLNAKDDTDKVKLLLANVSVI